MLKIIRNNRNIIIAAVTPLLGCIIMLLVNQVKISDLSIECSKWNDELFFYKQLEGILEYGNPIGFWGFNESTSVYGNFAAWNPTIFFINYIFAQVFGLNYNSPFVLNLAMMSIAFLIFEILCKPTTKQLLFICSFFISYSIGIRYIFSITPEIIIASMLLMYCSILFNYNKTLNGKVIIISYPIICLLIMMRGYYAAFSLLAISIFLKHGKKRNIIIQVIITILAAAAFLVFNKYFTAEYFEPIVHFDWLENPILLLKYLKSGAVTTFVFIKDAIFLKSMRGSWYLCYVFLGIVLAIKAMSRKNTIYFSLVIIWVTLLFAMWIVYSPSEGCRHIMDIELVGILFIPLLIDRGALNITVVIMLVFLNWGSRDDFYTSLPIKDTELIKDINSQNLEDIMIPTDNTWDNTIIWVYNNYHNELYALPEGFGINCCMEDYIIANIDKLKAKYIYVSNDSQVNTLIVENGYEIVAEYKYNTVYSLR